MTTRPDARSDIDEQASRLVDAVESALAAPTSYRDTTPLPRYGPTPPVPQPGTPPMSQRAVDISRTALHLSLATVPPGLLATAVLVASQHADPVVVGLLCAAPAALAVPVLALARLLRSVGDSSSPQEVHHHYSGPVTQTHTTHAPRGVWVRHQAR